MNLRRPLLLLALAVVGALTPVSRAFVFIDGFPPWPDGNITLELQLGNTPTYSDGTTPNSTAIQALGAWNPAMQRVKFTYVNNSNASKTRTNGRNNVFFDSQYFGTPFPQGVLAVTVYRSAGSAPAEADVVVNTAQPWDSYRGSLRYDKYDLRRVLAHEFGHVLGLGHPDQAGQWVSALMNAYIGDIDAPVQDDKDGASARYGHGPGNPAIAPTFSSHPDNVWLTEGQSAYLFAFATGTEPITYQWMKDGAEVPGATLTSLNFTTVRKSDEGKYALKATNDAGSVTSNEATVTVATAQIPVFQTHPTNQTVEQGAELSLNGWASSNTWISYQWTFNGVNIPNATDGWLRIPNVTTANAGEYRLIASTIAGSATSNAATVTIIPAKPPVIHLYSPRTSVIVGQSVSFSAWVSSATPVTYQWMHEETPVPNATSPHLSIADAKASDAGSYRLVVTNAAGSVSSDTITLTVNPLPPPSPIALGNTSVPVGSTISLDAWAGDPAGRTTYQWYRNGAPIPGATSSSLYISSATYADAGEYFFVATNPSGSATSTVGIVSVSGTNTVPSGGWKQAVTDGDIVYFLFENPARLERFDLTTESWLSPIAFTRTPVAMTISGPHTAVVAFYRTLTSVDLTTGSESSILTLDSDPTDLGVYNGRIYVVAFDPVSPWYRRLGSVNPASPSLPTWTTPSYYIGAGLSIDATHGKAFTLSTGISPSDICSAVLNSDGTIGTITDSPYHGSYVTGTKTWVNPSNSLVFDNAGTVYATEDLTSAGSLGGSFESIAFRDDGGAIILHGRSVAGFTSGLAEIGQLSLTKDAHFIATRGDGIYLFTQPSGTGATIAWTKRTTSELTGPAVLPSFDPAMLAYTADDVHMDRDGNVFLFSRLHGNVFRWSVAEQRYTATLPLVGRPNQVAYHAGQHRLYTGYADGRLRGIDLATRTAEQPLANLPGRISTLCDARDFLVTVSWSYSSGNMHTYAQDGTLIATRDVHSDPRWITWNAERSRIYQIKSSNLGYVEIGADGKFGLSRESYITSSAPIQPIRISPSGDVILLGNGKFYNADTLAQNNELPNALLDATWLGTRLVTMRDTLDGAQLQRWGGSNYGLDATRVLGGRTIRLFACGPDRLLAVTQKGGRIQFTLLDSDLVVRNHIDATPDLTSATLANLSTRAIVGTGDEIMVAGFVVTGDGPKRLLVRGIGPGLDQFGVGGTLADPVLHLVRLGGTAVASNDDWASNGIEEMRDAFHVAGAFAIDESSADAALVVDLPPGPYTAQIHGKSGATGVALVEAYDLDPDAGERRMVNISTRARVGTGSSILIPGLVIDGTTTKRLLVRAIGPSLSAMGVSGALADPRLELINAAHEVVVSNDDWGSDNVETINAAAAAAGAFALAADSRDAALVVTLPPGSYTIAVSGVGDTSGIALVEVYEVP